MYVSSVPYIQSITLIVPLDKNPYKVTKNAFKFTLVKIYPSNLRGIKKASILKNMNSNKRF